MWFVLCLKSYLFSVHAYQTFVIYIILLSLLRQYLVLIWVSFIFFLLICLLHFAQCDLSMLVFRPAFNHFPFNYSVFSSPTLVFRHFIRVFELFRCCSMLYSLLWKDQHNLNAFTLVLLHFSLSMISTFFMSCKNKYFERFSVVLLH